MEIKNVTNFIISTAAIFISVELLYCCYLNSQDTGMMLNCSIIPASSFDINSSFPSSRLVFARVPSYISPSSSRSFSRERSLGRTLLYNRGRRATSSDLELDLSPSVKFSLSLSLTSIATMGFLIAARLYRIVARIGSHTDRDYSAIGERRRRLSTPEPLRYLAETLLYLPPQFLNTQRDRGKERETTRR